MRSICPICNQRPVAINYRSGDKIHYRKICDSCIRKGKKLKPAPPAWVKSGYRKKDRCEKCGWQAKYVDRQMAVYHIDGNLRNNNLLNLKTICLNCRVEIAASHLPWREAEIKPDF